MGYTLYYSPGACSLAIHAVLRELGQTPELVQINLREGENRKPEFLALNSRGQVPVLKTPEGKVLREGAAIIQYLVEKHPSPLSPASADAKQLASEWLAFANSTLHPAYGLCFFLMRNGGTPEQAAAALQRINGFWADVNGCLASSPFVAGSEPCAADFLLAVIAGWSGYVGEGVVFGEHCKRMFAAVSARPSFAKALQSEGVEYKAAA